MHKASGNKGEKISQGIFLAKSMTEQKIWSFKPKTVYFELLHRIIKKPYIFEFPFLGFLIKEAVYNKTLLYNHTKFEALLTTQYTIFFNTCS